MLLAKIGEALLLAVGMMWQVAWSLILGFTLSGMVQALVSKERMQAVLGRDGIREIALATGFGAASSSCSYAAAAMSKTLFKKGAALVPSLAFLFSSTNLVLELGVILWVLMGWQFTAAEWIGGLVLIAIMTLLVRLTYPKKLIEEARRHVDEAGGHDHGSMEAAEGTFFERLRRPETHVAIAQNAAMDFSMLWKDLIGGFVIAVVSFVCSIGNVPLAAILWTSGISFGGVLAFLYADLIVLPLLDIYRKYYGVRMMLYMFAIFFVTMAVSAMIMDGAFSVLHLVPTPNPNIVHDMTTFSFNYTFWLNVGFGALALYLWRLDAQHPMDHGCHHDAGSEIVPTSTV